MRAIPLADFLEQHSQTKNLTDPIAQNEEVLVALLQLIRAAKKLDHAAFPAGIMLDNVSLNIDAQGHVESAVITPDDDNKFTTQKNSNAASTVVMPSLNNILCVMMCCLVDEKREQSHWLQKFLPDNNATSYDRRITAAYLQLMLVHFLWQHHIKPEQTNQFCEHLRKENFPIITKVGAEYIYLLMCVPQVTPLICDQYWIETIAKIEQESWSQDRDSRNEAQTAFNNLAQHLDIPPDAAVSSSFLYNLQHNQSVFFLAKKQPMTRSVGPAEYDTFQKCQSSFTVTAGY